MVTTDKTFDLDVTFGLKGDEAVRTLLREAAAQGHLAMHAIEQDKQGNVWLVFSARLKDSTEHLRISVQTYWNSITVPES